jgi:hypothetical protein
MAPRHAGRHGDHQRDVCGKRRQVAHLDHRHGGGRRGRGEEPAGRPFFLYTGGFDGRQARTRRQIEQLCRVQGRSLVAIENLSTLKSTGRGKGVKGR